MKDEKIRKFIQLAGQVAASKITFGTEDQRKLGAQLLLSELMEYIIKGLGVVPEFNGTKIDHPENFNYHVVKDPNALEMLDGLADVAYTMYWNSVTFGLPLEQAFELVCDNNLEKFVKVDSSFKAGPLEREDWHCKKNITWPAEVVSVEVLPVGTEFYAVGKDKRGKVRKPSSYKSVDLTVLI